ncbi:MAG: DUF4397 domain-containing protein [Bacteroidetes bacterium]|jgi:plastocyanin|nr:DUF4397 domain-containing protein [Bacteroidota bacterium]
MQRNFLLLISIFLISSVGWAQTNHNIEVTSNEYTPEDITITVGDTVTWENIQGSHNVDGRQLTYPDNPASFYSGPSSTGWTFSHVFTEEGFYDYECTPHAAFGMVGTITVEPAQSNTAEIQIVHNSPSPTVDIWVNDDPFLTDVEFRTATDYVEVPAGVNLNVGIAEAGSSSPDDIIVDFDFTLDAGENYQIIANGIVGDSINPFNLEVIAPARQEADSSGVDFTIFHGSPDAPNVDVFARDVAQLADDLAFADNTDYINVPAAEYTIDIKAAGTEPIVASYAADLSGLEGGAATVLASGFLNPGMDDPAFGLFAVLADGTFLELESVENTADLQIVHNSPSPTVDIWVNDAPFLTDVEFRTATEYVEVPAGVNLNVGIAAAGSTDTSDIITDFDFLLDPDESYQVIANGVLGDSLNPFNLEVIAPARQEAESGGVDFTIFHGSPDAPNVDVFARDVAQLADNLAFAENTAYINVPADEYTIDVKAAGTEPIVVSYAADLSGLEGGAATVLASGFLAPDANEPAFGLFAVLADGTFLELESVENTADLQIVHNSPSPTVDIWVNDEPFLTDVEYRTATPFVEVPAGVNLNVGIAEAGSTDPSDIITDFDFLLDPDKNYVVVANGVINDTETPFDLDVVAPARLSAESGSGVDFAIVHGSTDAPAVDINARDVAALAENLAYGDVTDYLNVPAANYTIDVLAAGTDLIAGSFLAPLTPAEGAAAVVVASGFLNPATSDDPNFALLVVFPDGTVIALPQIENTARLQIVHNSPSPTVDIWVNNDPFLTDFDFRTATEYLDVPAGVNLNVGVAPAGSSDTSDILVDFDFVLEPDEAYQVIANGIIDDANAPFNLEVITPAREAADSTGVDFVIFHGSPDAPGVDVFARDVAQLADNLEFTDRTDYINVPATEYTIDIAPAGVSDILASYTAPLSGLEGGAATVMASGFLNPGTDDPAFGLFTVLPDGTVIELPVVTSANQPIKGEIAIYPNPSTDRALLNIVLDGEEVSDAEIQIRNMSGKVVAQPFAGELYVGRNTIELPVAKLKRGFYLVEIATERGTVSRKLIVQ